ncbi:thaumatin [Cunninghamella echinulata]|nr:thaumatin [Cunninghamella echinulata]
MILIMFNLFYLLLQLLLILNWTQQVKADVRSITIQNNCPETLSVGVLTNGQPQPDQRFDLPSHGSRTISKPDTWGGRLFGQPQCSGGDGGGPHCGIAGAANPATLAEFFFKGNGGKDFYDISMVDGYNIPASISPQGVQNGKGYDCGTSSCKELPSCPPELAITDATGKVVGCQSSCSKTGDPQHCCKGNYDDPKLCQADEHAKSVKKGCPDSYSFAYDDQSSTFTCANPTGYTVSFC